MGAPGAYHFGISCNLTQISYARHQQSNNLQEAVYNTFPALSGFAVLMKCHADAVAAWFSLRCLQIIDYAVNPSVTWLMSMCMIHHSSVLPPDLGLSLLLCRN